MHPKILKISLRSIFRNKVYAAVNIIGLAMGVAAFVFLLEYVSLEKTVNGFHANLPDMYRLLNEDKTGKTWEEVEPGWALQAKQRYPEIKDFCRFETGAAHGIVNPKDEPGRSYREESIGYVESNFFSFFSFPLKEGNAQSLQNANTVFVSETTAKKYFGSADPVGKMLVLNNQFGSVPYTVTGVFKDMKDNSDIRYDMTFSYKTLESKANLNDNDWATTTGLESQYIQTYFLLNKGVNIASLENKLSNLRDELKKDKDGVHFRLQAFASQHLGASMNDTFTTAANMKYVYMLGGIALLIILIAWFNYINLSTATSFKRANEVGVRKVIGASRKQIIQQFMIESLLVNVMALLIAVSLVYLLQPFFNQLVGKELSLFTIGSSNLWIYALLLFLGGAVLSGGYTAFALSKFNPVQTLKGKINKTTKGVVLRKSLVVSQFTVSILLIMATILVYAQLNYMRNQKLGINTNQLLVIRGPEVGKDSAYKNRRSSFLNTVASESFVKNYCISGSVPGNWYNFMTSGFTQPSSKKGDEVKVYSFAIVNDRFFPVYEVGFVAGRNFTPQECTIDWNDNSKVIMNETAIKQLGFTDPEQAVHTQIQWDERKLDIIGVVKDYHHTSVQRAIDPMIFYPQNNNNYITVRLSEDKMQDKIASLQALYKTSFPGNPFDYFFVDENYNKKYATEKQYGDIFFISSAWAIAIACLGLFGLVTFTVESRVKEIGVRKVLGASVQSIVAMLSKDFLVLVLIAFVIATPLAWYGMNAWLQDFATRLPVTWWIFIVAGVVAALIALLTISLQAIKAAVANPVKSLRSE